MKNLSKMKIYRQTLLVLSLTIMMIGGVFVFGGSADAAVTIDPATGGGAISIDATSYSGGSSTFTTLTGPIITEGNFGDIGFGLHYIDLPAGWESDGTFSIGKNGTTELGIGASGYDAVNHRIYFNITSVSTNVKAVLSFSFIKVKPNTGTVGTAYLTYSGAGIAGVTSGSTHFGTLTTVPGAANKIAYTTQPSSTAIAGEVFSTQPIVTSQDKFGNTRTGDALTITLTAWNDSNCDGVSAVGTFDGTNTELESSGVANFAGNGVNYHKKEDIFIKASDGTRTVCSSRVTVSPAAANAVAINTQPANTNSGTVDSALNQQPVVTVTDAFGNTVADGVQVWAGINIGSGSEFLRNVYATTAGGAGVATFSNLGYSKSGETFTVLFTANGHMSSASDFVTALTAGALNSIVVSPASSTITADDSQPFTAVGYDYYGNSKGDVTASTTFTIDAGAAGTFSGGATYAAEHIGTWTVTGTNGAFTDTSSLTVLPDAVASIVVSPDASSMTADDTKAFTATGYDGKGNLTGNVTASTVFSDNSTGTWGGTNNATFTAVGAGAVTITGTYTGGVIADTASLTVTPGALASMEIYTDVLTMTADSNTGFIAEGFDADGNTKGMVTGDTTFVILHNGEADGSDGGTWVGPSSYTAHTVGVYQVRGTNGAITHTTTSLTITHGAANKYVIINPSNGTVDASIPVTVELQDDKGNLITTGAGKDTGVKLIAAGNTVYGYGDVIIANGTGHLDISDSVAETVGLSLRDDQHTGLNVSSTQDVIFAHGTATNVMIYTPTDGTVDNQITINLAVQD